MERSRAVNFFGFSNFILSSLVALSLASCSLSQKGPQLDPFAPINPLQKFNPFAPDSPLAATVVSQWEKDFAQPNFLQNDYWHTEQGRNELVYRLIFMADYRFSRYEVDVVAGRAAGDTIVDMAVLGLTSAAALTTPGQATRILSAISGGLIGSRAAIQKNIYQNQTTSVLLDRMRVLRAQKLNEIVANLALPPAKYPVELALIQVLDYYNRGTVLAALQDIANNTAIQQIKAQGGAVTSPPVAPPLSQQIRISTAPPVAGTGGTIPTVKLSAAGRQLKKFLGDQVASLDKSGNRDTAVKILQNLGASVQSGENPFDRLRSLLLSVKSDKDLVPLQNAFTKALKQDVDQNATMPQEPAGATPSASPASSPIPISTPKDVPGVNGSLGGKQE